MFNKRIDFNKAFKPFLIGFAAFMVVGILCSIIFGVNLSIDFKGGTRIAYSYSGEVKLSDVDKLVEKTIDRPVNVTESSGLTENSKKLVITLAGNNALSNELQEKLDDTLTKEYKENKLAFSESNSVAGSVAGGFFARAMAAVILTGVLVLLYVGIRFRKIGGVSAALTAFAALFIDIFVAFFTAVIFRLQIDMTFLAVILTILGYSLNDTIVVYDRIRENKGIYPNYTTAELVNESLNTVKVRTIVTTVTTFLAVVMIIIVAEIFGLSSLRPFAIPMAFGLISGCLSSLFISAPLWVMWKNNMDKKAAAKNRTNSKKAKRV